MSHTTTIKGVSLKDADIIRRAVQYLQDNGIPVSLEEHAVPRMYYKSQEAEVGTCDFVLRLGNNARYDVGLKLEKDKFVPYMDLWGGDVARVLGNGNERGAENAIGKFLQAYGREAAIDAAISQGYMVEDVTTDAEGNMHVVIAAE